MVPKIKNMKTKIQIKKLAFLVASLQTMVMLLAPLSTNALTLQEIVQGFDNPAGSVLAAVTPVPSYGPDPVEPLYNPSGASTRIKSPAPQMHFTAGLPFRFFADSFDPNDWMCPPGHPPYACPDSSENFYVDGNLVGTLPPNANNYNYWELRLPSGLTAGDHTLTVSFIAHNSGGVAVNGAVPVYIHIDAAPTHANTVNLNSDLVLSGSTNLNWTDTTVHGNGFKVTTASGYTGSITINNSFIHGLSTYDGFSIDANTSGSVDIQNSIFEATAPLRLVVSGSGNIVIKNNEFRSNNYVTYVSSDPDKSPILDIAGSTTGSKIMQGNNFGGGIVSINGMGGWQIGGLSDGQGNVFMGPRAVLKLTNASSGTLQGNYFHHDYKGGWSQGFNLYTAGSSNLLAEHNIIRGGSWLMQSFSGEFRYNLIADEDGHNVFRDIGSNTKIHHNVFTNYSGPSSGSNGALWTYLGQTGIEVYNNTFDYGGSTAHYNSPAINIDSSARFSSVRSNSFTNFTDTGSTYGNAFVYGNGSGLLTSADYNAFYNPSAPNTTRYSSGLVQNTPGVHDVLSNPNFSGVADSVYRIDEGLVWLRSFKPVDVLSYYRSLYTPAGGSPVIDVGDPAEGTGNDIGAVGSGAANTLDKFGILTQSTDTQAPSVPTGLVATAVSSSQINLSWNGSTDNVGVSGYKIFRNGTQIATVSGTSYSSTGLSASTLYSYTVASYDAAGNTSAQSSAASATTQAGASDTTAPTVPTNLSATAISDSQINLVWTASTDNVGVFGYKIYRNGTQIASTSITSFSSTGLTASTLYSYTVAAYDAAGNNSTQSLAASATTQGTPVVGSHPKIFLNTTFLNQLKSKAAANDPNWVTLKAQADSYATQTVAPFDVNACSSGQICYTYEGHGWYDAITTLGLAYQVTGNVNYANKVIEILNVANAQTAVGNLTPISADSGYPSRSAAAGIAIGFDWVYDRLDATTKTNTINTLNAWYDWYKANAFDRTGPAYSNYFGGHVLGFGLAGLATAGDNTRSSEITTYIRGLVNSTVSSAFNGGIFSGGFPSEGYVYGTNHFGRLLRYMLAVKTATGEDLITGSGYGQKIAKSLFYNEKPNRWQFTDEADYAGDYTGILNPQFLLFLAKIMEGTTDGAYVQYMYNNIATPPDQFAYSLAPFEQFMWSDSSRPAQDYRLTQPLVYNSPGDEHLYTRTSWQDNAVWSSFAAGGLYLGGHAARNAGHIAIQRGNDYLLVNSGQWKGPNGWGGNPQAFDGRSWRANTLFYKNPFDSNYNGGQGYWGVDNILASESGAGYSYKKADLSSPYTNTINSGLVAYNRSFVSLMDGTFAVFDRVKAPNSTDTKKIYWHYNLNGMPQVSGNQTVSTVGSSKLFMKTLLPASPVIAVAPDPASDTNSTTVTYRTEITDSVASTDLNVLNVISVTDSGVAAMDPTVNVTSSAGNMVGGMVNKASGSKIVMFSLSGTNQSSVTYSAAYSGAASHYLFDIAPGTYDVYQNGSKILTGLGASAQGVLSFNATGGGSFNIVQTGTTPPPSDVVPPTVSITAPISGSTVSGNINITADATDNTAVAGVSFKVDGNPIGTEDVTSPYSISLDTTTLTNGNHALRATARDTSNNTTTSVSVTINVSNDTTAPGLSNIQVNNISTSTAVVSWTTDEPSTSGVDYGLTTSYGLVANDGSLVTNHQIALTNLSSAATYHFRVRSADATGNLAISLDNSFTTASNPSPTPPAAITNLSTAQPTKNSIKLNWTAPGSSGNSGTALSYDIRYSTSPITSANWSSATQVTGEPSPTLAGTSQSYTVVGLNSDVKYYVAMTTTNSQGLTSALSNVASFTTKKGGAAGAAAK